MIKTCKRQERNPQLQESQVDMCLPENHPLMETNTMIMRIEMNKLRDHPLLITS